MTIMPSDLPLSSTGVTDMFNDSVADAFPLFESVQSLARLGVRVAFKVQPSTIIATITVDQAAASVLPALLAEIDDARPGTLPTSGKLVVTGSMCQGTVILRIVIPEGWVTAAELAVLTGTASIDTTDLR